MKDRFSWTCSYFLFFYRLACFVVFFYQLQGKIYKFMQNWLLKAKQEEFTKWHKL